MTMLKKIDYISKNVVFYIDMNSQFVKIKVKYLKQVSQQAYFLFSVQKNV